MSALAGTLWVDLLRVLLMADIGASFHFPRKRHAKSIKTHDGRFRFVLGHDIYMDRVSSLCSRALVGRLSTVDWVKKPGLTGLLNTGNRF